MNPAHRFHALPSIIAAGLLVVLLTALLAWGANRQPFNYDEVLRAHSLWLTQDGQRPYRDFLEVHPPYFRFISWTIPTSVDDALPGGLLLRLRAISLLGNILFLVGLMVLAACAAPLIRSQAPAVLVVLLTSCAYAAPYLVEFRMDGWGWAATAWLMVYLSRSNRVAAAHFLFGFGAAIVAVFLNPKAALLPPLVLAALCAAEPNRRRGAMYLLSGFTGAATGLLASLATLWATGENLPLLCDLVVRFNILHNSHTADRFGLAKEVASRPVAAMLILWAVYGLWRGRSQSAGENGAVESMMKGVTLWLGVQLWMVSAPHKQYWAPWLLWAAIVVAYSVIRLGRFQPIAARILAFLVVCTLCMRTLSWQRENCRDQIEDLNWLAAKSAGAGFVVATPPFHPIVNHDAFYLWWNAFDPDGFDSEEILARIASQAMYVEDDAYRRQLIDRRPGLVVLETPHGPPLYPRRQRRILLQFLHENNYLLERHGQLLVALDPGTRPRQKVAAVPGRESLE